MDKIHLYGDIGSTMWFEGISDKEVVQQLRLLDLNVDKHYIHINSVGGLTSEGITIMNVLRAHKNTMKAYNPKFRLETVVDGYAMSAASLIFLAGDDRKVALGGVLMIHDAWNYMGGNAKEMRKTADVLDMISNNAADLYAVLSTPADGRNAAYFRGLMSEETYFTGKAGVDVGLATEMDETLQAMLSPEFTPEKIKGHYVERMTSRTRTTMNRPVNPSWLTDQKASFAMLAGTAAELGIEIPGLISKA